MNTFVMLNVMGHAYALMECAGFFSQMPQRKLVETVHGDTYVNLPPTVAIDLTGARRMVSALLNEHLTALTPYNAGTESIPEIARVLTGRERITRDDILLAENFLTEERVDNLVLDLTGQLDKYVLPEPWRQWDVVDKHTYFGLIGGQDYRATLYEQSQQLAPMNHNKQLVLDLRHCAGAIQEQLRRVFGSIAMYEITARPLIAYGIHLWLPNISLLVRQELPLSLLQSYNTGSGPLTFEKVYEMVAGNTMSFICNDLKLKIDKNKLYSADVTDACELVIYPKENPEWREQQEIEDLRRSIERGDWVCESDRRRVEQSRHGVL